MRKLWLSTAFLAGVGIGAVATLSFVKTNQYAEAEAILQGSWLKAKAYDMPTIAAALEKAVHSKPAPEMIDIDFLVNNNFLPKTSDIWFCPAYLNIHVKGGMSLKLNVNGTEQSISNGTLPTYYWYSPYYLEEENGKIYVKSKVFPKIDDFWVYSDGRTIPQ